MSTMMLERPSQTYRAEHLTYCSECGYVSSSNEFICEYCGSDRLEPMPRSGEVYSFTVIQRDANEATSSNSFILALVQLSGGPVVMGQIVGVDRQVEVGTAVEIAPDMRRPSGVRPSGGLYFAPRVESSEL